MALRASPNIIQDNGVLCKGFKRFALFFFFAGRRSAASVLQDARYYLVVFFQMRTDAAGAVLYALLREGEAAAAFVAQKVERTVAEKAAEIIRIRAFVTGKILAFFMRKILEILAFHHCPAAGFGLCRAAASGLLLLLAHNAPSSAFHCSFIIWPAAALFNGTLRGSTPYLTGDH